MRSGAIGPQGGSVLQRGFWSANGWRVQAFLLLLLGGLTELSIAMPLGAQTTSEPAAAWTGVVCTTVGKPLAGATVTVITAGAHQERHTAVTGADGHFAFTAVTPRPPCKSKSSEKREVSGASSGERAFR